MAEQSQNQGTSGTNTPYTVWPHQLNWSYNSYNTGQQMYNMNSFYAAQCYNQQGYQSFPSQTLNFNYKSFVHGGTLETANNLQKNEGSGNSPPLPNGPAPSQPPPPQFDGVDFDKLPPLPPGSPPLVCDVPLPPQPNVSILPPMPQTKNGRKKWRKKQRNLMEAALANQSTQVTTSLPMYQNINFVPPVPILPPTTSIPTMTKSSFSFTPIVPSNLPPQPIQPTMEVPSVQKKQNSFDLPSNCPNSLREYIQKCQDKCVNKIDQDRMDIILKGKITNANHDGSLWIKDWSKEPMPMLLSENITINQNQENNKNKNSFIKIAFKKTTNNYVSCYFNSKFKSSLSPSSTSNESIIDMNKKKNSPLRENKRHNNDDFIPLNINNEESNSKKYKYTNKNKKLYNEDAHMYQQYGSIGSKPNFDKNLMTKRAARFLSQESPKKRPRQILKIDNYSQKPIPFDDDEFHIDSCHVVGTCLDLEKKYLRLTAAPDADAVRPLHILVKSLQHVKSKWMNNSDYHFACDQLKSIRQDLTVQGIRDPFTVEVYETHARIALEKSDMGEFNQCQTQLCDLYEELRENPIAQKHRNEFFCYNILYCIYTRALSELNSVILNIKESNIKDDSVDFALKAKDAWWLGNHVQLFSLYKTAPKMAAYLMDMFLARERNNFYLAIAKSYRPTIPISTIQDQMAFDKHEDCLAFLKAAGAIFTSNNENIDCKASCGSTDA